MKGYLVALALGAAGVAAFFLLRRRSPLGTARPLDPKNPVGGVTATLVDVTRPSLGGFDFRVAVSNASNDGRIVAVGIVADQVGGIALGVDHFEDVRTIDVPARTVMETTFEDADLAFAPFARFRVVLTVDGLETDRRE